MAKTNLSEHSLGKLVDELRARNAGQAKVVGKPSLFSVSETDPDLDGIPTPEIVAEVRAQQKAIYGVDDRKDFYEIAEIGVLANLEGVAAIFDASEVIDLGGAKSRLSTTAFKTAYRLCDSERFGPQPCGAFCSGFLVGEDLIATAGHCVSPKYLSRANQMRFVFGYRMADVEAAVTAIPNTDIYAGKEIVGHALTATGADWALVRLDRAVHGRPILSLRRSGKVGDGASVYVIGHPCGLPVKYAPGATVRDNDPVAFFSANLDTYGGNSGSPVFNAAHEVEGILVRGETDFVSQDGCNVSLVVPSNGGRGEDVTRTAQFQHLVPPKR